MKRTLFSLLFLLLAVASLVGCTAAPVQTVASTTAEPLVVERLELVSPPDKTLYVLGQDKFDPTGMVLDAVMSDGSTQKNVAWTVGDVVLFPGDVNVQFSYGGKSYTQVIHIIYPGSVEAYSAQYVPVVENSPLKDKVIFWLGSSVTYGSAAEGETMAEFIAHKHQGTAIKEAVSGTTLATYKRDSYVERWDAYLASPDKAQHLDAFVCQLSTNDQNNPESFGVVTADDVRDPSAFDTATTFGAMEYIVATVQENYGCPVFFYTNPPTGNQAYMDMVLGLYEIAAKWDVKVIDMFMDIEFQSIPTDEEYDLWMADKIHPTKAGYRDWWTPKFEEALLEVFAEK